MSRMISFEQHKEDIFMRKVIALVLALTMLCGLMVTAHADDKIKIGVSIWSSTDTLGSEVKRLIDAAADALGS